MNNPGTPDPGDKKRERPALSGADRPADDARTIPSEPQTIESTADRAASPRIAPGTIGSYTILGTLGEGGMGVVYEAEQQNPKRKVALKVVRGGHLVDEVSVKMFQREAESLGQTGDAERYRKYIQS